MHVGAAGPGSLKPEIPPRLNGLGGAAAQFADFIANESLPTSGKFLTAVAQTLPADTVATQLTNPDILKLLSAIEQPRLSQDPARVENLMDIAIASVERGDHPGALRVLSELVALNPERGQTFINAERSLAPIRVEATNMLEQMTLNAKAQAEHLLTAASLAVGLSGHAVAVEEGTPDPQAVLAIAVRFFESGQLVNFLRAGELGQNVLAYYGAPVVDALPGSFRHVGRAAAPRPAPVRPETSWLRTAWRRVPLLVLLAGWLAAGIAWAVLTLITGDTIGNVAVETWAAGFLGLVGFQFYASIRNARF